MLRVGKLQRRTEVVCNVESIVLHIVCMYDGDALNLTCPAAEGVPNESGEAVLDNGQANPISNGISVAKTSGQEKDDQAIGLEQGGEGMSQTSFVLPNCDCQHTTLSENLPKTDSFAPAGTGDRLEDSGGKEDIAVEEN